MRCLRALFSAAVVCPRGGGPFGSRRLGGFSGTVGPGLTYSGFTGSGYPKAVPQSLARRLEQAHERGEDFRINLLTGASTAPELDGALAKVDGIAMRMPFQSDPDARKRINAGKLDYLDIHLSHVAQHVWFGFYNEIDTAVVEVAAVAEGIDRYFREPAAPVMVAGDIAGG